MAKGFKHGAGGSNPLNFKVICNPQPETAKENTIWVDTDRINNYYFSATQPENMAEYDVWFPTGTSSTVAFSATKKNPIMVYPLSAKQYISGALVDKTAKSYQGGKWVEWIPAGALYWNGYECTAITGGWYISRNMSSTLTKNADSMVFDSGSGASSSAIAMNNGLSVEYDKFTTVNIKIGKFVTQNYSSNITLAFRTSANHDSSTIISEKLHTGEISADTVLSLPIPSAAVKTLLVYVYYGTATIKEIWME